MREHHFIFFPFLFHPLRTPLFSGSDFTFQKVSFLSRFGDTVRQTSPNLSSPKICGQFPMCVRSTPQRKSLDIFFFLMKNKKDQKRMRRSSILWSQLMLDNKKMGSPNNTSQICLESLERNLWSK
ncbi:hypothetical protein CDAR_460231 [Caerostris darwini]|uniref:Uncharacterized protein n=1 Tax=Caerostris darwini TaxID=1538125 RepID=A0AAV4RC37_9ARAC|nr:hypothetical protein CDAR_460231 [Caerostris darwini]